MASQQKQVSRRQIKDWSINFRGLQSKKDLALPPGFSNKGQDSVSTADATEEDTETLIVKRSWDIALAPIKQIPMNIFIMWMAGNTISIFPIMMVGMSMFRSFQAFFQISATFKMIEGSQANLQKFVFFLGNIAGVVIAVYKCQSMGLLPTHASDWLAFVEPQRRMEFSGGGVSLS
ncbi:unnamed protein product [Owenia fusiformis]|uniref:ER membrane protein complex subunit 4 n=1 Tax=Owenia fusiformis TaxID=6347 RepID=A0A8J1TTU9_OWEFU|nr:unnamed protein product [Owenia fusiformis]